MREERITAKWSWDVVNAALCFGGGILAGLLGSLLTSGTWIWGSEAHPWVRRAGTLLLILTIPLLILAGHCLDRMESRSKLEAEEKKRTGQFIRCVPQMLTVGVLLIGALAGAGASDNLYAQKINRSAATQNDAITQEYANRTTQTVGTASVGDEVKANKKSDQESRKKGTW